MVVGIIDRYSFTILSCRPINCYSYLFTTFDSLQFTCPTMPSARATRSIVPLGESPSRASSPSASLTSTSHRCLLSYPPYFFLPLNASCMCALRLLFSSPSKENLRWRSFGSSDSRSRQEDNDHRWLCKCSAPSESCMSLKLSYSEHPRLQRRMQILCRSLAS